jgi:hypothetical protein
MAARSKVRKDVTQAACEKKPTIMAARVSLLPEYRCKESNTILASARATTTFRSSIAGCVVFAEYNPIAQNRAIGMLSQAISDKGRNGVAEEGSSLAARKEAATNAPRSASTKKIPRREGRELRSSLLSAVAVEWTGRTVAVLIT